MRNHVELAEMISAARLPSSAIELLAELAAVLGVSAKQLRLSDQLADLARVARHELSSVSDETWHVSKFGDRVEPFAYDIMWLAESRTPPATGRVYHARLTPPPRTEEEWIDHFMRLRVVDFLAFVSGACDEPPDLDAPAL